MSESAYNRKRRPSEVLRRGYSNEEIENIYALGRAYIISAKFGSAEKLFKGLSILAPDYVYGHLGLAYCQLLKAGGNQELLKKVLLTTKQALRIDPRNQHALIFHIIILLSISEFKSAGSYLGELGEQVESGKSLDADVQKFFNSQKLRFKKLSSKISNYNSIGSSGKKLIE